MWIWFLGVLGFLALWWYSDFCLGQLKTTRHQCKKFWGIWYQEYICQLLTSLCNKSCYHSYNSRCKKCWVNTRSAFVISWHIPQAAPQSLGDIFPLTFGGMRLNERKCPLPCLMVMGVIFVAWVQLSYIDHLVKIGSK